MRLLVTGGCGFIGSNFIHYWLKEHPEDFIVNLDAMTYAADESNLEGIDENRYLLIKGDIRDTEMVKKAMDEVETIVHFAAESHVDNSINSSREFFDTNILGTQTLLEEMRHLGGQIKHFHHVSTDEVFGALELDSLEKFNEKTPYAPNSPYAASKAGSDLLVRAYYKTYGLPLTVSNCSNNYGPRQHREKLIPLMIQNAMSDLHLPVYGDGMNVRDWIHVDDHCRGIEAILERGKAGESYCLGGNSERPNMDIVNLILEHLGKPKSLINFVEDRKGHDRRYAIDDGKARRELGWEPKVEFEEGLKRTIEWYKKIILK